MTVVFLFSSVSNKKDYKSIFNGKNLDGWMIHGTEKWYAEDGLLSCESGPDEEYGYLSTEKFYDDFELIVEFKQEADGNSGVFFPVWKNLKNQSSQVF